MSDPSGATSGDWDDKNDRPMTDATELDEAAIRARLEAATPGPWEPWQDMNAEIRVAEVGRRQFGIVAAPNFGRADYGRADAEFIAHARTDVERLMEALDETRDRNERLETRCNEEIAYTDEAQSERDAWKKSFEDAKAEVERLHFDLDREAHARQAVEQERDEARAEVGKWKSIAEATLGANKVLLKAIRRTDREREAAEGAVAAVRSERDALAEQIAMLGCLSKSWREAAGDDRDAESKTLRAVCAHLDDLAGAAAALATPTTPTTSPVLTTWTAFGGKGWECPKCGGLVAIPKDRGPVACPFGCIATPTTPATTTTEGDRA